MSCQDLRHKPIVSGLVPGTLEAQATSLRRPASIESEPFNLTAEHAGPMKLKFYVCNENQANDKPYETSMKFEAAETRAPQCQQDMEVFETHVELMRT